MPPVAHDAADDARCCADCFQVFAQRLTETAQRRRALVGEVAERFRPLALLVSSWRARVPSTALSELVVAILNESGYLEHLRRQGDTGKHRLVTLRQLWKKIVKDFDAVAGGGGPCALLDHMSLARSADTAGPDGDRVNLLTMHTAKGLEFRGVIVAGAYDGNIPDRRAQYDEKQAEDERRLLYVAMTRAKERLELTFPRARTTRTGRAQDCDISQFLIDLPPELLRVTAVAD